jgi:hypothetical protein
MLTEDDLAAKVAQAFGEQAGRRAPATIDAAGIFRRGRRRRHRQLATRVASVAAAAGLVAGVVIGSNPSSPTHGVPRPAQAAQSPSSSPQPTNGSLPGNSLLDAQAVPALSVAEADAGMPRYYIVASDPKLAALEVRSSATGKVVSTVLPPAACDPKTIKLAAAGNNRDFVFSCLASDQSVVFYRLQVSSSGAASALIPLSIPASGDFVNSVALSADGNELAVGYQNYNGKPGVLEVVTLATGQVRTWTGGSPFDLTWGDGGREVAYSGNAGLYVINVSGAGGSLRSARLVVPRSVGDDDVQDAILSPDGTIIAAVSYEFHGHVKLNQNSVVGGIVEISATTGKPLRTLLAMHAHYSADGGGSEAGYAITTCELGAIDATGHHMLVSCDQFGRLDRGRFTPLPGPGPQDALYTSAW